MDRLYEGTKRASSDLWRTALAALVSVCAGCAPELLPTTPIATRPLGNSSGAGGRCLIVFLPGRRDHFGDYERRGFPRMAKKAGVTADFLEADAHIGYYRAETIVTRLHEDVIAPARARGAEKIWMVGISMGGLGAILYASQHSEELRGVIALAPFLGDEEPRLVEAAGGLRSYAVGAPRQVGDYERYLWGWLKSYTAEGASRPPIWIGFGAEDHLAPADRLLAEALPPGRTFVEPGDHDWKTWTRLWQDLLDAGILQRDCR
ncbi:MAG TPA: alpha/beta fold hydrolase [Thermoanaerobaculia bacterium]